MWKLFQNTPKRLPTWIGGKPLSPYTNKASNTTNLNQYTAQASYLTAINFVQKSKIPFLLGFTLVSLGDDGHNNSNSRGATVNLNACYYLTNSDFPLSKNVTFDFYFADLNSYKDLDWVIYYSNAIIYKDKDPTSYKFTDLKGLAITDRTTIIIRLDFNIFLPFLGFSPFIRRKKVLKLSVTNPNSINVIYYGKIYSYDKFLDFLRNTFFTLEDSLYLCP